MADGMTRGELLSAATRTLGYAVSTDVFKGFREAGLIPRPDGRGPAAVYPPGTLAQLIAVRRLHEQERRFDELRLLVWWEGYWVDHDRLVESLAQLLDDGVADVRALRAKYPAPEDAAEAALALVDVSKKSRSPAVRLFRSRMGRDDQNLRSAYYAFLVLAFGGEPIWHVEDVGLDELDQREQHPLVLVDQLMGISGMLSDRLFGQSLVSEPPDTRALLIELRDAGAFDFEHPGDLIRSASRQELEQARAGARAFWDGFINVAQVAEHVHGRDAAGLGLFALMRKRDFYWRIGMITRFWLLLPGLASEQHMTELVEAIEANRAKFAAAIALNEAFPGYKQFFTEKGQERLRALSPEEQEQVLRDVGGFVDAHPQVRCLLED